MVNVLSRKENDLMRKSFKTILGRSFFQKKLKKTMNIFCKFQLKISFTLLKSQEEFSFDGS